MRSWTAREETASGWSDIASGVDDDDIDAWAAELNLPQGRPTYAAFHHETENEEDSRRTDPVLPRNSLRRTGISVGGSKWWVGCRA